MASEFLEIVRFVVNLLVLSVVFYWAGIIVVGKKKALFSDAFVIALLGTIASTFFMVILPSIKIPSYDGSMKFSAGLGAIVSLIVWLLLIRHYYETGWLGALAVGILAVVVFIVLAFILSILLFLPMLLFLP